MPPIRANFPRFSLYIHPPSPFLEPLRDLLQSYTAQYPALRRILPFLDLWLRSHGITPDQMSESCLALMVIAYMQAKLGAEDIQRSLKPKSSGQDGVFWIERPSNPKRTGASALLWCDLRIWSKGVSSSSLKALSMGEMIHGFFRYVRTVAAKPLAVVG